MRNMTSHVVSSTFLLSNGEGQVKLFFGKLNSYL